MVAPWYPSSAPDDAEQQSEDDVGPSLADLLAQAGQGAPDASSDGTSPALDDPRGYGVDYGGTPSPNEFGGTGVDSYGPPAPADAGPSPFDSPPWLDPLLGSHDTAPGDYSGDKAWDQIAPPAPTFWSQLGGAIGQAASDALPQTWGDAFRRGEDKGGSPDLPGLPWALNGPGLFPHFQPPKPVRDLDVEEKVQQGEPLTGEDFLSGLTKAAGQQYQTTPAALEARGLDEILPGSLAGMAGAPGVHLGTAEEDLGRAFAHGLGEGSAGAFGDVLGGAARMADAGAGAAGDGFGLVDRYGRPLARAAEAPATGGRALDLAAPAADADLAHVRASLGALGDQAGHGDALVRTFDDVLTGAAGAETPSNAHLVDALGEALTAAAPTEDRAALVDHALGAMGYDRVAPAGATAADWDALGHADPAQARLAGARARLSENPGATAPPGGAPPAAPPNPAERAGGSPVGPSPISQHLATADALTRDLGLGVLANPASVAAIAIKNSLETPTRLAVGVLGSLARGAPQEVGPQVQAFGSALRQALPRFWTGMTAALEEAGPRAGYEGIETRHDVPVIGGLANLSRNAVRPHVGLTEATSRGAADQEVARLVQMDATGRGLTGADRAQWVADLTSDVRRAQAALLGDKSPGALMGRLPESAGSGVDPVAEDIARRAIAAGQRSSYTEPLGPVATAFQTVIRGVPVLGQVAAPYTKIPSNVAARAVETSPIGVVATLLDVARGAYGDLREGTNRAAQLTNTADPRAAGVSPLNERLVRNMIGAGAVATGYALAQSGIVTGERPDPAVDPHATALFDQRARPANSVLIAGHSVPLAIFGTTALGLKMGAELADAEREGRTIPAQAVALIAQWADETPARGTLALAKALAEGVHAGDQGGMSGALETPDVQNQIESQVERWLPGAGLLRGAANALDPVERQVTGPLQAAESVVPGLRNTLPPRLDQTGRERPNPRVGLGALNPVASRQETANPVLRVLDANGVTVSSGKPPEEHAPGAGWTPAQLDLYHRRLGALVERNVNATVGSPERVRQVMDQPGTPATKRALEAAVARARKQLYDDPNLGAQLDSTPPERLRDLSVRYAAARNKESFLLMNIKDLGDYHAWAKAHGVQGGMADPRVLARYVALRPR